MLHGVVLRSCCPRMASDHGPCLCSEARAMVVSRPSLVQGPVPLRRPRLTVRGRQPGCLNVLGNAMPFRGELGDIYNLTVGAAGDGLERSRRLAAVCPGKRQERYVYVSYCDSHYLPWASSLANSAIPRPSTWALAYSDPSPTPPPSLSSLEFWIRVPSALFWLALASLVLCELLARVCR
jgi:hypothetical protein